MSVELKDISTTLKQTIRSKKVDSETTKKDPQKSVNNDAILQEAPVVVGSIASSEHNPFEKKQAEKDGLDDIKATPETKETLSKLNSLLTFEDFNELLDGKPSSEKTAKMLQSGLELAKAFSPSMAEDFENLLNEVKNDIAAENNEKFGNQNGKEKTTANPIQMANIRQNNGQKNLNDLISTISSEEDISVSDGGSNTNLM